MLEEEQTSKLTLITCPTPTRTEERYVLTAIPVEQATADHPQNQRRQLARRKQQK